MPDTTVAPAIPVITHDTATVPTVTPQPALPPNGTPGVLVYLCRLCHGEFTAYPIRDSSGTLKSVIKTYGEIIGQPGDPAKLALAQYHGCADGRWGIGDIIGMAVTGGAG